ncbi:MAG: flagellar hook-basal body complex protein FliE [Planctomycetota bacterium]|jgi:flagellar hook-basal body complex protein FliE
MIQFNPNISSIQPNGGAANTGAAPQKSQTGGSAFSDSIDAAKAQVSNVDQLQQASDVSIQDLLSGKNEDVTSVVSQVAKADMSFKLLVGVRNKLVEAYKETMNMPI